MSQGQSMGCPRSSSVADARGHEPSESLLKGFWIVEVSWGSFFSRYTRFGFRSVWISRRIRWCYWGQNSSWILKSEHHFPNFVSSPHWNKRLQTLSSWLILSCFDLNHSISRVSCWGHRWFATTGPCQPQSIGSFLLHLNWAWVFKSGYLPAWLVCPSSIYFHSQLHPCSCHRILTRVPLQAHIFSQAISLGGVNWWTPCSIRPSRCHLIWSLDQPWITWRFEEFWCFHLNSSCL